MTEKELLYIEDALNHEAYFKQKCSETINCIQDGELKNCVQEMSTKHNETFKSLYSLLG
ncbi:MAG: hypothetical protein LUH82_00105 [Clostridiales bacterium]|nr:hypothetical protein [Clostridiales bacterium]